MVFLVTCECFLSSTISITNSFFEGVTEEVEGTFYLRTFWDLFTGTITFHGYSNGNAIQSVATSVYIQHVRLFLILGRCMDKTPKGNGEFSGCWELPYEGVRIHVHYEKEELKNSSGST